MEETREHRRRQGVLALRIGLVLFVLVWIFGWLGLRSTVPIWLPFLIALGLELQFFAGARRESTSLWRRPHRPPQVADRARAGSAGAADETEELLLVRDGNEELWIPYAGETGEELDDLIAEAREQAEQEPEPSVQARPATQGRRSIGQLLVGVGVIAALAVVVWVSASRGGWHGIDPDRRAEAAALFSAEASEIVGRPVEIRCDESGDHVGAVQHADGAAVVGGRLAFLTPERCLDLYRLAFEGEVSFSQTARSLAVLAHEAWHLRGVRDEGTTECYALQSGVELGRRLGLSEDTARQMMRQQLAENVLRARGAAEYLLPRGCHDGGSLDLHTESSRFP